MWNSGDFRFVSFTHVALLVIDRNKGNYKKAYDYIAKLKPIKPSEFLLADMLRFYFLSTLCSPADFYSQYSNNPSIKILRRLFLGLFHLEYEPYNVAYKIANDNKGPCLFERQILNKLRQFALRWHSIPVYVVSSESEFVLNKTEIILSDFHYDQDYSRSSLVRNRRSSDNLQKAVEDNKYRSSTIKALQETGLNINGYDLIVYPSYDQRGRPAGRFFIPSGNPDLKADQWNYVSDIAFNPSDPASPFRIIHELFRRGIWCAPESDESNHNKNQNTLATLISETVRPILNHLKPFRLKKIPDHIAWRLEDEDGNMPPQNKFRCLMFFPVCDARGRQVTAF